MMILTQKATILLFLLMKATTELPSLEISSSTVNISHGKFVNETRMQLLLN